VPDAPSTNGSPPTGSNPAGVRDDPYIGRVLDGRYAVRELVAVSAMSRVYKVTQLRSGKQFALKILAPAAGRASAPDQVTAKERFVREATTLANLAHPNIIELVDYGVVRDCPYMVMPYLAGDTLLQVLRDRSLSPREAIHTVDEICNALAAAHERGVVHRDIKPSNVFMSEVDGEAPRVLLFDFGIAKALDDSAELTGVDAVVGTVWYMAPEQAMGDPIDARTDIYALGAMLYRLLVGRTPFGHHRGVSVLVAHINESPPTFASFDSPPSLPPVLEWTVRRCLEKQANKRFRNIFELRKALAVCRLALDEPELDTGLELEDGRVYASEAVAERLHGTELLTRQVPTVDPLGMSERTLILVAGAFLLVGILSATALAIMASTGVF